MKIKVSYTQTYMGKTLTNSFIKTVSNVDEARGTCERVGSDPDVIDVGWKPVSEERTIRYEWYDLEGNYNCYRIKVPLTATHADIESAIYNQLSDLLGIDWEDVEE
ncbi:hypothetical protein [Lapidilactobacillus dextrinicus]|uniref:hypothetical protein n=1 Tax=Lapidilactobacillus dextrinicus TaxID=51664 RepID=UPI003F20C587